MNIEIGYFPKSYYKSKTPDAGGFFPFVLEGNVRTVVDFTALSETEGFIQFIQKWMKQVEVFPIYIYSEIPNDHQEEFAEDCKIAGVSPICLAHLKEDAIFVVDIHDEQQFKRMMPFFFMLAQGNETVVWTAEQNNVTIEKRVWSGNLKGERRETIVFQMAAHTSVYWIGYDGDGIVAISNDPRFESYEQLIETLPEFTKTTLCEYGEI